MVNREATNPFPMMLATTNYLPLFRAPIFICLRDSSSSQPLFIISKWSRRLFKKNNSTNKVRMIFIVVLMVKIQFGEAREGEWVIFILDHIIKSEVLEELCLLLHYSNKFDYERVKLIEAD
jgi:hypothetical protein